MASRRAVNLHRVLMTATMLASGWPVALAQTPAPAGTAADASAAGNDQIQEVVVTARRRSEIIKDTPIAVSAFSADQLAIAGANDITDLTYLTPSTSLFVGRGSNSTLTAYIRGIGQQDPTWGSEPGVGLYVDDVYFARPQATVLDIYNISQIEVLNGPQGTLYGKNTIGGAIKYVTKDLPDVPTADVRFTYGSYNEHDVLASFGLPVNDKIRVGGSIAYNAHDGWGKDLTNGAAIDNKDEVAGRVTVEFLPTDDLTFKFNADQTDDMSNANPGHKEVAFGGFPVLSNKYDSYAGESSKNFVADGGISLTATWDIDPSFSLQSITAYRRGHTNTNIDFDGLPPPYLDVPARYNDHQTSEEVKLTYSSDRLHGVAGVYYLDGLAGGEADFEFQQLSAVPISEYLKGNIFTVSWAGYFDASYDITDDLTLSFGGRYSNDAKTGAVYQAIYFGIPSPFFGGRAANPLVVNTNYTNHKSFGDFTPRVSLSYKITPDITSYVSYAEGFRAGGFDIRGDAAAFPATKDGYQPETVDTYEAGIKGDYLDRHLQVNFDGYYSQYKNQQLGVVYPLPGAFLQAIENAASSHIEGLELSALAKLAPSLTATIASSYTFAAFDQFNQLQFAGVTAQQTVSGFQYTPKWTASLELTYTVPLAGGALDITGNVAYRSFTQIYDNPSSIDQPGYTLLGANLIWTAPDGDWSVSLKGSNLTDERYRVGGYYFPGAPYGNSVVGFYGPPRTFLASVEAKF